MKQINQTLKTKILFFTTTLEKGGAETQMLNLITELNKTKKFKIKVLSITGGFFEKELKKLKIETKIISNKVSFNLIPYILEFKNQIKTFKPQIVHSFLYHSNIISKLSLFTLKKDFKLICSYRSIISKYPTIQKLEKINFKKADLLISNSNSAKNSIEYLTNKNQINSIIINNGISEKKTKQSEIKKIKQKYKNKKIILTTGNLRFEKDYQTNIKTCKEILKTRKDIIFLYAGNGILKQEIQEQIKKEKLSKYIKLLGNRNDIPELIKASDLFFLPTLFESQPNAIMEAMLYKTPIVTTNIPAIKELGPKAKLCELKDFKTMASKINQILDQKPNKENIEDNYKIIKENFSNKSMSKKYINQYNKIIQ